MVTTRPGKQRPADAGGKSARRIGLSRFTVVVAVRADARQLAVARKTVRRVLHDHRRLDDVLLVVSELVTNACLHGSTDMDALVYVRVTRLPLGLVYVSVADGGRADPVSAAVQRPGAAEDSGLGLVVVDQLAWRRWQHRRVSGGHRVRVLLGRASHDCA